MFTNYWGFFPYVRIASLFRMDVIGGGASSPRRNLRRSASLSALAVITVLVIVVTVFSVRGSPKQQQATAATAQLLPGGVGQTKPLQGDLLKDALALESLLVDLETKLAKLKSVVDGDENDVAKDPSKQRRFSLKNHPTAGSENTIFVAMGNLRDTQCASTLQLMYGVAAQPSLVYAGVVESREPADPSCVSALPECQTELFCPRDNIRLRNVPMSEARGPTHARYLATLLYRGQKYILLVDAHTVFLPQWDQSLLSTYARLPRTARKVISQPLAVEENRTNFYCSAAIDPAGAMPELAVGVVPLPAAPMRTPWVAQQFLFADALLLLEVPVDPFLDFVQGTADDVLLSARLWTHKWDVFAMPLPPLLHKGTLRTTAPGAGLELQAESMKRVQYLMHVFRKDTGTVMTGSEQLSPRAKSELGLYGMGHKRTLDSFYVATRINPKSHIIDSSKWCPKDTKSGPKAGGQGDEVSR